MFRILKRKGKPGFPFDVRGPALPIIADAAIGTDAVSDGRLIPLVIVDTATRPDIAELISIQSKMPPGDVLSQWATLDGSKDHLALLLRFQRPIEADLVLNFDLAEHGGAVELAVKGHVIYLQAGKPGDRLYRTLDAPRIFVELGAGMPPKSWEGKWKEAMRRRFQAMGLSRSEAKKASLQHIENLRSMLRDFGAARGMYVFPD
jgi:hypothetical protein